jgi:hypothetical protein
VSDAYLDALLVERKSKTGDADALAAIDAEIARVGGTVPGAPKPAGKPASSKA